MCWWNMILNPLSIKHENFAWLSEFMYMLYEHFESKMIMIMIFLCVVERIFSFTHVCMIKLWCEMFSHNIMMLGSKGFLTYRIYTKTWTVKGYSQAWSTSYLMYYVGLSVNKFFHDYDLNSRHNVNSVGINA